MKARILEAISFITEDNWTDAARIRKDVFFKLFGEREQIKTPGIQSCRWVATGAANRVIDADAFGQGNYIFTMCYNQYYSSVIRRLYGEVVLVDDYTVEEFIEDLQQLRRQAKKDLAMAHVEMLHNPVDADRIGKYKAIMVQTKCILNMMFDVFSCYDFKVNSAYVVEYARLTIRKDCKKLQDEVGAIILTVNTDTIVLVAKKIPSLSFDTHNNLFNSVLIGAYAGQYAEINKSCDNGGFYKISRMPKAMGRVIASQKEFNDAV